jgi:hypothetical protein
VEGAVMPVTFAKICFRPRPPVGMPLMSGAG